MNVIHIVISLATGGLERLVVDWTNARNQAQPGSTHICCLDELGALAGQVEGENTGIGGQRTEDRGRSAVVVCVNAKRSRWPFDLAAVQGINQLLSCQVVKLSRSCPKAPVLSASTTQQPSSSTTDNRRQPVVLHAHNLAAWQYAVLAKICTSRLFRRLTSHFSRLTPPCPPRIIYTQHGANIHNFSLRDRIRARLLACFTNDIVAVSTATAKSMSTQFWLPLRKIRVIANGVKTREPPHLNSLPKGWGGMLIFSLSLQGERAGVRVGIMPGVRDTFVIGSVGRLAYVKGYDRLIAAFAALKPAGATLILVGDGPEHAALEQQARDLGVADQIVFAGYQTDPAPYLSAMDLFVLPSRSEGLSVALLEAMAAGVPVAVTDVGANREVIEDGRCGVLLPEDTGQWSALLTEAATKSAARQSRIEAAQIRVKDHFSLKTTLKNYETLYSAG